MTFEEAEKLARILGTADHGCPVCVGNLIELCNAAFPQFEWKEGEYVYDADSGERSIAVTVVEASRG